jgi:hypothetical protein
VPAPVPTTPIGSVKCVSWNVACDEPQNSVSAAAHYPHGLSPAGTAAAVGAAVQEHSPDVVALQETPAGGYTLADPSLLEVGRASPSHCGWSRLYLRAPLHRMLHAVWNPVHGVVAATLTQPATGAGPLQRWGGSLTLVSM